jgi:hypothetical protein
MCDRSDSDMPNFVGKKVVDDRKDIHESSNNDDVILWSELPANTRVLGPNDFATMDFDESRLNLHIDEDGVVVRQRCG